MRSLFYDFQIDGKPILTPDCDISVEMADLHDADTGRDESGVMHLIVIRRKVKTVPLSYAVLSAEEYLYMESLFDGKDEFRVDYRGLDGQPAHFTAYRSKHGITIHNARTGRCKNYKFNIIEC